MMLTDKASHCPYDNVILTDALTKRPYYPPILLSKLSNPFPLLTLNFPLMNYTSRETYQFLSQQTNDPIVERKTCKASGQPFPIFQSDLNFYDKLSPTFNGTKYLIPPPTICPEERAKRRFAFRNERKLYRRKCNFSGKEIISLYSPDKPFNVWDKNLWWSDQRSPLDYGRDFDFSQSFSENFRKLLLEIPLPALSNDNCVNSDYCNFS